MHLNEKNVQWIKESASGFREINISKSIWQLFQAAHMLENNLFPCTILIGKHCNNNWETL